LIHADPHPGTALRRVERLEQPLADEFLAHAGAGVADLDQRAALELADTNAYSTAGRGCVLRVRDQVPDHARETIRLRMNPHGQVPFERRCHAATFRTCV